MAQNAIRRLISFGPLIVVLLVGWLLVRFVTEDYICRIPFVGPYKMKEFGGEPSYFNRMLINPFRSGKYRSMVNEFLDLNYLKIQDKYGIEGTRNAFSECGYGIISFRELNGTKWLLIQLHSCELPSHALSLRVKLMLDSDNESVIAFK